MINAIQNSLSALTKLSLSLCLFAVASCATLDETAPKEVVETAVTETVVSDKKPKRGIEAIQELTTPNGISIWLVDEPFLPMIEMTAIWKGGSLSDPKGVEGLTDTMTWLMNEGAGDVPSQEFFTKLEELNMSFGCSNSANWIECEVTTLSEKRKEAFELVTLAFEAPRFDEEPMARSKREDLVAIKRRPTNAGYLLNRARAEHLLPDHPYTNETTEESLNAITRDKIKAHYKTRFAKDNLHVVIVGDLRAEEALKIVDDVFESLPETSTSVTIPDVTLADALTEPIIKPLPRPQSSIRFSAPGPLRADEDYLTAHIVNYILGGGGFSSRLMDEIREKQGLTYGIGTGVMSNPHYAIWQGQANTQNETAGRLIGEVKNQLTKLYEDGITEEELEAAKLNLTGSYPLAFDSNEKIKGQLIYVYKDKLGTGYFAERNALLEKITLEDCNRVIKRFLHPDNFTFYIVGEPELD